MSNGYCPLRLTSAFRTTAARRPGAIAISYEGREISYRQMERRINRIANLAADTWSIKPGDVVALLAPNRPEYIEIVFALSDLGAIVATLNPRLSPTEIGVIFEDCNPRLAIIDPSLGELAAASEAAGVRTILIDAQLEKSIEKAKDAFTPAAILEEDSFCLCYTSGTTGKPKGVLLSHRSRALTAQAMAIEYGCFGQQDRFLALAPLCHGAGFAFAAAAVSFGGTCEIFNGNDPGAITQRLCKGDVSGVFMVPTHFSRIYQQPGTVLNNIRDDHGLRTIISNAAALPQVMKEQTVDYFGAGLLHETYGSTEAGIVTNIQPADILRKPGSVGLPFLNTKIEIRKPDGALCAPGEIGELYSRAPYTFNGYLNRRDATAETIKNGWVTVQDLASRDEGEFITICGRMKDMIISGGVNIYPAEIEKIIEDYPGVKEAAVVGLPDPEWGERVHAFVVTKDGRPLDEASISAACRSSLARYKVPQGYSFILELPKNLTGKLLKRELRTMAAQAAE